MTETVRAKAAAERRRSWPATGPDAANDRAAAVGAGGSPGGASEANGLKSERIFVPLEPGGAEGWDALGAGTSPLLGAGRFGHQPARGIFSRFRRLPLWRPLASPAFRFLWLGESASLLADNAFFVALTWLVLGVVGAGADLGSVLAVAAVPGVVLLPLGGWLSDRLAPARLMAVASGIRALLLGTLAGVVLLDAVSLWHLYLLGGLLSAVDALYYPASLAIVPSVVPSERLGAANALVQGAEQVAGLIAPALAAAGVAAVGLGATFGATAVACAAAAAAFGGLVRSAGRFGAATAEADGREKGAESGGLLAGVRAVWSDPLLRALLLILAALNVATSGPILVGGAVLAEERFGGAGAFGTILSAFAAGSLLGLIGAGSLGRARRRGRSLLAVTLGLGVGLAGLGVAPTLSWAALVAGAMGIGAGYLGVVLTSWLQERVAPALRGRVMGLVVFATVALDPVSYAVTGLLIGGDPGWVFLGAGLLLGFTAVLAAASRTVRRFD